MAKKSAPDAATKITPQDIENKLRALQGDVQGKVDEKKRRSPRPPRPVASCCW